MNRQDARRVPSDETIAARHQFWGTRDWVKLLASQVALEWILRHVPGLPVRELPLFRSRAAALNLLANPDVSGVRKEISPMNVSKLKAALGALALSASLAAAPVMAAETTVHHHHTHHHYHHHASGKKKSHKKSSHKKHATHKAKPKNPA
jgi:hypothetical protein